MLFQDVAIAGVAHVDAPVRMSSAEIVSRLRPAFERFGIRSTLMEEVAGIAARRVWDGPMQVADAATAAGRKVLQACDIRPEEIGLLVSTSVSRDYIEPSTASVVHGNLHLPETCQNFDIGNACLAFLDGMDIAGCLIERGQIGAALIVDGEASNAIIEATIARLNSPNATVEQFRDEFASLTLGSGAVAMVLRRREGHRYRGGVTLAATQFSHLCRGTMERMSTDTRTLLVEGLNLAARTFAMATEKLGWSDSEISQYVVHQVSKVHTDGLIATLGLDPAKVLAIYPEHGNIGPASIPIVLSKLDEEGQLRPGRRLALLGIGSGLNCTMSEIVW